MSHAVRRQALVLAGVVFLGAIGAATAGEPAAPAGAFVHHPDIRLEPWAWEPMVVDPVALAFADDGACYVVEMRDYPLGGEGGTPGGTVRRLRDTDGDGRADEAIVFAEGLSFPTSVLPWRGGVLVCAPPEVLYLEDTDGDGRADRRETVLEGLVRGVTDSNANSLRFGVDGLVHLANGGNGGRVRIPWSDGPGLDLGGADIAFDPGTGRVGRTYKSGGGFGLVADDAGHSFTTYNLDHLQQRLVPVLQVERARDVEPFAATASISDHGESAPLFPVSAAATRPNHPEQAGRFSSAGGMGFIDGAPFSERLARSVLVCDVVTNVVHRDRLVENGAAFRGTRASEEEASEFLASRDPAFRPVAIEPGPDGALYLADMQRDVIEHPDYIPAPVRAKLDLRAGSDRGRIWRILPTRGLPDGGNVDPSDPGALVADLGHPFRWRRDTAHRLLVSRYPADATLALRAATAAADPVMRLRAWRILSATGRLGAGDAAVAARDADEDVRETAVALAASEAEAADLLLRLLDDDSPRVRFAAALALDGRPAADRTAALLRFLQRDIDDPWARRACFLAADSAAGELLREVWRRAPRWSARSGFAAGLRGLAHAAASGGTIDLETPAAVPVPTEQAAALLGGLRGGWRRHPEARPAETTVAALLAAFGDAAPIEGLGLAADFAVDPPPRLASMVERARADTAAVTTEATMPGKLAAIRLLGAASRDGDDAHLIPLLAATEPPPVQRAALEALGFRRSPRVAADLVAAWPGIDGSLRPELVGRLVDDRAARALLLDALENGDIALGELNLDLEQRRRLLADPAVGGRAAALFGDDEYGERAGIVEEWLARMPADGDAARGETTFRARCSGCHRLRGTGHRVGPDLDVLAHRAVEDIVTHVLDPNVAINPGFVACVVETEDGRAATGLLVHRGPDAVTLRRPEGVETLIPTGDIVDLRILATSLMPTGLEQGLSPADLRDLVAFLQGRE